MLNKKRRGVKLLMIYEQIYQAALKAIKEMGPEFKKISWFKRNWPKELPYDIKD